MKRVLLFIGLVITFVSIFAPESISAQEVKATQLPGGESLKLSSKSLGEDRELLVYLPASYSTSPGRQYPVIFAFDGGGTAPVAAGAQSFMTGYSSIPQIPEAIVVGVVNANRNRDMYIAFFQ